LLTGPVTILQWSFVRDDQPLAETATQVALALRDEIHDLAAAGLTVLVSTHYMDEAERCHELAYISYGKLLTHGTVAEVIAGAGLVTWSISGGDQVQVARALKAAKDIRTVASFGTTLHVSADSDAALTAALATIRAGGLTITPIAPSLEDVFIALMQGATDNFGPAPQ